MIGSPSPQIPSVTVVEDSCRECIATEIEFSFPSQRGIRMFEMIARSRQLPTTLESDNGGHYTSDDMLSWSSKRKIDQHFIEPGRSMQNGSVESFNGQLCDEFLNEHALASLNQVRAAIEASPSDYNHYRPRTRTGGLTPARFLHDHLITILRSKAA